MSDLLVITVYPTDAKAEKLRQKLPGYAARCANTSRIATSFLTI